MPDANVSQLLLVLRAVYVLLCGCRTLELGWKHIGVRALPVLSQGIRASPQWFAPSTWFIDIIQLLDRVVKRRGVRIDHVVVEEENVPASLVG